MSETRTVGPIRRFTAEVIGAAMFVTGAGVATSEVASAQTSEDQAAVCQPYEKELQPVVKAETAVADAQETRDNLKVSASKEDKLEAKINFKEAKLEAKVAHSDFIAPYKEKAEKAEKHANKVAKDKDASELDQDKAELREIRTTKRFAKARKAARTCIDFFMGKSDADGEVVLGAATVQSRFEQGDKPCGRVITESELRAHFEAQPNVPITNPVEAKAFLAEHPNLKTGMTMFYDQEYAGMLDWVNVNLPKTDPSLADGDRLDNYYNRLKVVKLTEELVAENHQCDPNSGAIDSVGLIRMQVGDFVYGVTMTDAELATMKQSTGLTDEDLIIKKVNDNGKSVNLVATQRGTCDNPLSKGKQGKPATPPIVPPTPPNPPEEVNDKVLVGTPGPGGNVIMDPVTGEPVADPGPGTHPVGRREEPTPTTQPQQPPQTAPGGNTGGGTTGTLPSAPAG